MKFPKTSSKIFFDSSKVKGQKQHIILFRVLSFSLIFNELFNLKSIILSKF